MILSLLLTCCVLMTLVHFSVQQKFMYFKEFTNVVDASNEHNSGFCTKPYFRSQTKSALYVCMDTSNGMCDDDPDPDPCQKSSQMHVLSDDQKSFYIKEFDGVDCLPENLVRNNDPVQFDTCGVFNEFPTCNSSKNFDGK